MRRGPGAVVLLCMVGCGGRTSSPRAVTADSVQGRDMGFTAISAVPFTPRVDTVAGLTVHPVDSGEVRDTGLTVDISYDGSPARLLITSPDGRQFSDTTDPEDRACAALSASNSEMGCEPETRRTLIHNTRAGIGTIQFTGTDSGIVAFSIEVLSHGGRQTEAYWGGMSFHLRRGQTHTFQVTLPGRREEGKIQVTPLTSPVDTNFVVPSE